MALTFSDLQSEVKRRSTRNQSGTEFDTATKNVINTSLIRVGNEALWKPLRRATTFSTTASTESYVLDPQVADRFFIWHESYGYPFVLFYVPEQEFLSLNVDKDTTGTPTHYRTWTTDMIKTQPSSASVVTIVSSSSSDTNISVTVFGTVSSYPDYEIIVTNASSGTTSVAGSKSFTKIDRIVKASSSIGRITATSNAAVVTLAVLPVGDTTAGIIYRKANLYPVPSSTITMNVYFYKDMYRLVNDGDVHELGHHFDEAIILLSVAKINYETNKDEGDKFFGLYNDEIKVLKKNNVDKIDWFPKLMKPNQGSGYSPLVHPYLTYAQIGGSYGPRTY
jgi:hypothetical protein